MCYKRDLIYIQVHLYLSCCGHRPYMQEEIHVSVCEDKKPHYLNISFIYLPGIKTSPSTRSLIYIQTAVILLAYSQLDLTHYSHLYTLECISLDLLLDTLLNSGSPVLLQCSGREGLDLYYPTDCRPLRLDPPQ